MTWFSYFVCGRSISLSRFCLHNLWWRSIHFFHLFISLYWSRSYILISFCFLLSFIFLVFIYIRLIRFLLLFLFPWWRPIFFFSNSLYSSPSYTIFFLFSTFLHFPFLSYSFTSFTPPCSVPPSIKPLFRLSASPFSPFFPISIISQGSSQLPLSSPHTTLLSPLHNIPPPTPQSDPHL